MSSQQLVEPKSSYIIPDSIEVAKDNPNKRYFKIFLLNNAITRTIDKFGTRFKIENLDVLDRDIDTFIGRPLIPFNDKKAGKHVSPKDAGIYQHRYANKLDYIAAANKYYDDYGKAKIIAVYRPDRDLLEAARNDPTKVLDYRAECETTDEGMIKLLDQYKKNDEEIYVSPGLVAIDSYYNKDGVKIVRQFAATHSHIVDEPAFTEPVAYIHKHVCNKDGKTCYFDLLTAAEEKDLFNNAKDKKDMSSKDSGETAGFSGITEALNNPEGLNNTDQNGITSKTEIADSKGNVKEIKENKNANEKGEGNKENKNKQVKKADEQEVEKTTEKVEKTEKIEKVEKEAPLTKTELMNILNEFKGGFKDEIIKSVEEKSNEKIEAQNKLNVLGKYFDAKNEEVKETYDFYHTLPITSDQLARVLEDSRYNPQLGKAGKSKAIELTASSYSSGIRSSKNIGSKINDNTNGRRDTEIHYDPFHGNAGKF